MTASPSTLTPLEPATPVDPPGVPERARVSSPKRNRKRKKVSAGRHVANTVVWLYVAFNVFALVWIILTALRKHKDIFHNPIGLPIPPQFNNFVEAWNLSAFGPAFFNSLFVTVFGVLLIQLLAAPAAYVLSRMGNRLSSPFTVYFVMGLGVPMQVVIIPLFFLATKLQMVNTLWGYALILVAINIPFTVFLLTGFFKSIPLELEEAAALDGASPLRTFWRITLPLARSGMITAMTLNAIGVWNEMFVGLIILQNPSKNTLPLALMSFLAKQQYSGDDYGQMFAGVCILILPVLALYIWLGRRIIEGMTMGAGK